MRISDRGSNQPPLGRAVSNAVAGGPNNSPIHSRTVTGPAGRPFFGNLPAMRQDPTRFLIETAKAHGGMARLQFGPRPAYLVTHPDYVKHVLQDNYRNYIRGDTVKTARRLLGHGLATTDDDYWLRQRRLMQPAFHQRRLARLSDAMVGTVATMLDAWCARAKHGQPVEIVSEMLHLTLAVIVKTMFSLELSEKTQALEEAFTVAQAYVFQRSRNPLTPPLWLPTPTNRRFRHAVKTLDEVIYGLIAHRRLDQDDRGDLLSMLLQMRDEETGQRMSDVQLRDEVLTIFFAGHQTTATALAWTWYALATHSDVDRRVRAEVEDVLAGHPPTYADLRYLSYTQRACLEAMRLYPPIWLYARQCVADDVIDGYRIPAGIMILLSPYVTHHDPALWPQPDLFDPDRFTPERTAQRPTYAYYPFGNGPHLCIGNNFALMEAQIIMAMVVQTFRLQLVPGHPIAIEHQIMLRPKYGMQMSLQPV